jgi:hypothetical protein
VIVFKVNSKLLRKPIENYLRKALGFAAEEGDTYAALSHHRVTDLT